MSRLPDFASMDWQAPQIAVPDRARCRRLDDPGRHPGEAGLWPGRPEGTRLPFDISRHRALSARPLPDHVRQPALDHPAICRLLHGRGFQRLLPAQSCGRSEGPVGRLRSRHPSRLRFRPSAGVGRCRHGGRRDQLDLRHEDAVLGYSARSDDRFHDDERRGAAGARALHRRRRRTGRAAGRNSPARSRTTSSKSSWCGTPISIRPRRRCASSRTFSRSPRRTCRSSIRSRSPAITCRKPARRRISNSPIRSPTASNMCAPAWRPASRSTNSRRACRSSGRSA